MLGASGMLGHVVCRELARRHEVHGSCRDEVDVSTPLDVATGASQLHGGVALDRTGVVSDVVARIEPAVVVNCAGVIKQKDPEGDPESTIRINSLLPHELARTCDDAGAKLITVSTDCVFSGRRGRYRETDAPDPVDLYGHSKLLGEVSRPPHLTLRTSLIGRQLQGDEGLLEWFLRQRGPRVPGFANAIFTGLTTAAFAAILDPLLGRDGISGIYHVASAPISKLELLRRLRDRLALDLEIVPSERVVCDRSLDGSRFERDAGIEVPSWESMIERLADEVGADEGLQSRR